MFAERETPKRIPNVLLRKIPLLETVLNLRNEDVTGRILNKTYFDFDQVQRSLNNVDNETKPAFKKYDKVLLKMEIAMDLTPRNFTVMSVVDDQSWLMLKDLENTCDSPNAHVHARDFRFREEELALFQAVEQPLDVA